ncbi:MAG: iron-containing redox enzyme family protein, partial [Gemmatimonadales bacterium]
PSIDTLLTESVERWNLLNHPFYKSWSAGTLPVEALACYAREYGAFIGLLPLGWETQEDAETADEEREHAELWGDFAGALHTIVGRPTIAETEALCDSARSLFAEPATAMGALYAFEAQQPPTATSKLDGLRQHYTLGRKAEVYFQKHTANHHEARKLRTRIEALSPADQQRAGTACDQMGQALWNALSGMHAAEGCM